MGAAHDGSVPYAKTLFLSSEARQG